MNYLLKCLKIIDGVYRTPKEIKEFIERDIILKNPPFLDKSNN